MATFERAECIWTCYSRVTRRDFHPTLICVARLKGSSSMVVIKAYHEDDADDNGGEGEEGRRRTC